MKGRRDSSERNCFSGCIAGGIIKRTATIVAVLFSVIMSAGEIPVEMTGKGAD